MSTSEFFIGQGNRLPLIQYRLAASGSRTRAFQIQPLPAMVGGAGGPWTAIDLTGCTITFQMVGIDGPCCGKVIKGTATPIDVKGGAVSYAWAAGDTDVPGNYKATWTITNTSTQLTMDVPNEGYILLTIRPKVGQ
jgi:hypothetical protein